MTSSTDDQKTTSPSRQQNEPSKEDSISDAQVLLASGKRHLLVSAIPSAVSDLAECCEILSKLFGETAVECAEAYYYYGKALLEISRLENQVLGNALEGVDVDGGVDEQPTGGDDNVEDPEKMSEEEKKDVQEKVGEALDENFENHDRVARAHMPCDPDDYEGDDDSAMDEDAKKDGDDGGKDDKADDEEPSNLQLSWEMLELSKVIYGKIADAASSDDKKKAEANARICECLLCLGEVSLENENYSQAVADFTECLGKRQATLPPDSRSIAETHYQLGVAQAFDGKVEDSELCLNNAISVLEARIANLGRMETSDNLDQEVGDLKDLVTEIKEKIDDYKNMATAKVEGRDSITGFPAGSDKPVSSIGIKKNLSDAKTTGTESVGSA